MLRDARNYIFVWSMGLTQHAHEVETIEALINVALVGLGRAKRPYAYPRTLGFRRTKSAASQL
jgi:anaerobic selenocysteine-containing dehydrogenase